jgi:hypothetical protein
MLRSTWICNPRCRCTPPPVPGCQCPVAPGQGCQCQPPPCVFPPEQIFVQRNIAKCVFLLRQPLSTADPYFPANFISQTTTRSLCSRTALQESRAVPSKRFASSDTQIVVVSKLATTQSEETVRPSLQIQYFGRGLDPLENSPRGIWMIRLMSWRREMCGCRCRMSRKSWVGCEFHRR